MVLDQSPQDFHKMLIEVGYLACFNGHADEAAKIFAGLPHTPKLQEALLVGQVFALMAKGALAEAKARLYEALEGRDTLPETRETLVGFQGVIAHLEGNKSGSDDAMRKLKESRNPALKALAVAFLEHKEEQGA